MRSFWLSIFWSHTKQVIVWYKVGRLIAPHVLIYRWLGIYERGWRRVLNIRITFSWNEIKSCFTNLNAVSRNKTVQSFIQHFPVGLQVTTFRLQISCVRDNRLEGNVGRWEFPLRYTWFIETQGGLYEAGSVWSMRRFLSFAFWSHRWQEAGNYMIPAIR